MKPLEQYLSWLAEAKEHEPSDPDAAMLATVNEAGQPSARIILVRQADEAGFVFFTNLSSDKGQQIQSCPKAALTFYWKSLYRQIRIEGEIAQVEDAVADQYFAGRPRGSQIGAWASKQSSEMAYDEVLSDRVKQYEAQFQGQEVPRPSWWSGYRLVPHRIEFWEGKEYRLHDRTLYLKSADGVWKQSKLYP